MLGWLTQSASKKQYDVSTTPPIYVRGLSRSGGTLLVTILDTHPDIAMSYEVTPQMVQKAFQPIADTASSKFKNTLKLLKKTKNTQKTYKLLKDQDLSDLKTLLARLGRSNLTVPEVGEMAEAFTRQGHGFTAMTDCLQFVSWCCQSKMVQQHKSYWGAKCNNNFDDYLSLWPQARFLNIIRDGRDVLASRKNTGSFDTDPGKTGTSWANSHMTFHRLQERSDVSALEVIYEKLVVEPEAEIKRICEFLSLPFHPEMLAFHQSNLTIFDNPANHLSLERISKPIDATKVGRWKDDLTEEEIAAFHETAGDTLRFFGYAT